MSESLTPSGDVSPIHSDRAAVPLTTICACEVERLVTNTDCAHAAAPTERPSPIPASAEIRFFIESAGLDVACFEADIHERLALFIAHYLHCALKRGHQLRRLGDAFAMSAACRDDVLEAGRRLQRCEGRLGGFRRVAFRIDAERRAVHRRPARVVE